MRQHEHPNTNGHIEAIASSLNEHGEVIPVVTSTLVHLLTLISVVSGKRYIIALALLVLSIAALVTLLSFTFELYAASPLMFLKFPATIDTQVEEPNICANI